MDKEFPQGIIAKLPHENAPDFVKFSLSLNKPSLMQWLNTKNEEWINLQAKISREGKFYLEVDNWKPRSQQSTPPDSQGMGYQNEPYNPYP